MRIISLKRAQRLCTWSQVWAAMGRAVPHRAVTPAAPVGQAVGPGGVGVLGSMDSAPQHPTLQWGALLFPCRSISTSLRRTTCPTYLVLPWGAVDSVNGVASVHNSHLRYQTDVHLACSSKAAKDIP